MLESQGTRLGGASMTQKRQSGKDVMRVVCGFLMGQACDDTVVAFGYPFHNRSIPSNSPIRDALASIGQLFTNYQGAGFSEWG